MKEMTEKQIRIIAREEALKVQEELLEKMTKIESATSDNKKTLDRLYRLLLGELGVEKDDTLKAKADFAYQYAKRNTDLKIVDRALPALTWFERMSTPDPGCDISDLDRLGKVLGLHDKLGWLWGGIAVIGIGTLINAIPRIAEIIRWFQDVPIGG